MFNIEEIKQNFTLDGCPISNTLLEKVISIGNYVKLKPKEYIITPGTVDKSVWIVLSGVIKLSYFDCKKENVIGFGGSATIILSPISHFLGSPSFYGFTTITECEMLKISKFEFDNLLAESHEFTSWINRVMLLQFCALELKAQTLNEGDTNSNYKKIVKRQISPDKKYNLNYNRSNILKVISSKDLASYLGITQSYLSHLRKDIIEEERREGERGGGKNVLIIKELIAKRG